MITEYLAWTTACISGSISDARHLYFILAASYLLLDPVRKILNDRKEQGE